MSEAQVVSVTPLQLWLTFAGICVSSALTLVGIIVLAFVSLRQGIKIDEVHTLTNSVHTADQLIISQQRALLAALQFKSDAQQQQLHEAGAIVPPVDPGKATL